MVILDRLVHIRTLILHGAKVMCNTACNPINKIERVRISVDPNVRIEASFQQTSLHLIDSLIQAVGVYHVADRGHRHSGGISVVTFLINYGQSPTPHKAWGVKDEVAELALHALHQKILSCVRRCDELLAAVETVHMPLVPPCIDVQSELSNASCIDYEKVTRVQHSLERFRGKWEVLHDLFVVPTDHQVIATGMELRSLTVSGACNQLMNTTFYFIGTRCDRTLWQSLTGLYMYFMDGTGQEGWYCGYSCDPSKSFASHPSIVAMSPPPREWDCRLLGRIDADMIVISNS
jgi:hypothetical protein